MRQILYAMFAASTGWSATSENPEKPLKWFIPLKRSLKYPENWDDPWKIMKKSLQKLVFSQKLLFHWSYPQFSFLNFCKQQAIIIIVYCFTHLFFPFPLFVFIQVNSHCPRVSRALQKPSLDTEIVQEGASINSWTVGIQVSGNGFVLLLND